MGCEGQKLHGLLLIRSCDSFVCVQAVLLKQQPDIQTPLLRSGDDFFLSLSFPLPLLALLSFLFLFSFLLFSSFPFFPFFFLFFFWSKQSLSGCAFSLLFLPSCSSCKAPKDRPVPFKPWKEGQKDHPFKRGSHRKCEEKQGQAPSISHCSAEEIEEGAGRSHLN